MKKIIYGLDFGTSNSAVAMLDEDGQSQVLKIGQDGLTKTIRSVLFFPSNEKKVAYVGDTAIENYLSSGMKGRFLQSIKSILSSEYFTSTNVAGFGILKPEDMVALILKNIKKRADLISGANVECVVMGRPAIFSDDSRIDAMAEKRLLNAAQQAGFKEIYFQLEPIAAALHYESSLLSEKLVLVADIGGGTSDFTVMKLAPDKRLNPDRKSDILSSSGVYVGGDSFDSDIMWNKLISYFGQNSNFRSYDKLLPFPSHILANLCKWQYIGMMKSPAMNRNIRDLFYSSDNQAAVRRLQLLIDGDLGYSLFTEIEKSKILLSNQQEACVDFHKPGIDISEQITRTEFEGFIQKKLDKINLAMEEALLLGNVDAQMIDAVFITGGSSLIPAVRNIFVKKFGENKISSSDSFTSIASGLALSSKIFF